MKRSATLAERIWLGKVASLGCVICGHPEVEIHHLRHGMGLGQRNSHYNAVGLCLNHHRGACGIHTIGTKTWQLKYGSELSLLDKVYEQLGDPKKVMFRQHL